MCLCLCEHVFCGLRVCVYVCEVCSRMRMCVLFGNVKNIVYVCVVHIYVCCYAIQTHTNLISAEHLPEEPMPVTHNRYRVHTYTYIQTHIRDQRLAAANASNGRNRFLIYRYTYIYIYTHT